MRLLRENVAKKLNRILELIIEDKNSPEFKFIVNEMVEKLIECMEKLDDIYYNAFFLGWHCDFNTHKEIAEILSEDEGKQVNEKAVTKRLERATTAVVNCMEKVYQVI